MNTTTRLLAAVASAALLATACGEAPDASDDPTTDSTATGTEDTATETDDGATDGAEAYRACMVTDEGGVNDRSFNQTSFQGLQMAEDELGVAVSVLESTSPADYEANVNALLQEDCNLIVTVGFALGDTTAAAAEANPDQNFAIVDFDFFDDEAEEDIVYANVRELTFATDQAAFLAGYVAAGMSESGTVGTYGGRPFPTVTIFMDGYLAGAEYYNQQNDATIDVLGWDGEDGQFTGDFDDQTQGRNLTEQLLQNGADVIMPVAGPVGQGTGAALQAAGQGMMVWVDTDGFVSVPQFQDLILTSVMKNMDVAVFDTIQADVNDEFEGGLYVGTLENEGVDIAPYHSFEDQVPSDLKDAVDEIRDQIIAGELSVDPADHTG